MKRSRVAVVAGVAAAAIGASVLGAAPAFANSYDFDNGLKALDSGAPFDVASVHVDYSAAALVDTFTMTGSFDTSDGYVLFLAFANSAQMSIDQIYGIEVDVTDAGVVSAEGGSYVSGTTAPVAGVTAGVDGAGHLAVSLPSAAIPLTGPLWEFGFLENADGEALFGAGVSSSAGVPVFGGFGPLYQNPFATSTTVNVSFPYQEHGGTPATAEVTVQPVAAGSVVLYDGPTPIGSGTVDLAGHVNVLLPQSLSSGIHNLSAAFTPVAGTNYLSSVSPALPFSVHSVAKSTTTTVKLSKSSQHFKKASTAKVTVTVSGKPAGSVTLYDGTKKLKVLKLKSGKATYAFAKTFKKGTHKIKAVFAPKDREKFRASTSKTVKLSVIK